MLSQKVVRLVDPTPVRDWTYVEDHVSAYLECLENEKAANQILNFCTGTGYTVEDTVDKIAKLTDYRGEIQWGSAPQRPTESKTITGSYEKAKRILGWEPKWTLERGLDQTIKWWKENLPSKSSRGKPS
jgi:nucleoside-diphosphate-sugar epimerase